MSTIPSEGSTTATGVRPAGRKVSRTLSPCHASGSSTRSCSTPLEDAPPRQISPGSQTHMLAPPRGLPTTLISFKSFPPYEKSRAYPAFDANAAARASSHFVFSYSCAYFSMVMAVASSWVILCSRTSATDSGTSTVSPRRIL